VLGEVSPRATTPKFHPLVWWLWAAFLATSLLIAHSALVSLLLVAVTLLIHSLLKSSTAWSRTFDWALRLALFAFTIRMLVAILLGVPMPGKTLFTLPHIQLPEFFVGIRLGGPVTSQRLASAFEEAVLFVALILIFATANSLSNPHGLLRILPKRFYGLGVAGVIASSVAPQTARSIERVRSARRLRGHDSRALRSWRGIALPVLEESLERSIDLAASLESRGYGYFPKPTRYRPAQWKLRDLLAISGPLYILVAIAITANAGILLLGIVVFGALTPVLAS
jgi:energy-coupling factor transport system permease protein